MKIKISKSLKPGNFEKTVKEHMLKIPVNFKCAKCGTNVTATSGSSVECPGCHVTIDLTKGSGWD
ncbi:hypothetical protein AB9M75_08035 [Lactobacillus sp. AN1001]